MKKQFMIVGGLIILIILIILSVICFRGSGDGDRTALSKKTGRRIIFVPGWKKKENIEAPIRREIENIFGVEKISVWRWDSDCSWKESKENAEKTAEDLVAAITKLPENIRRDIILAGHSLGGRVIVAASKLLAEKGVKVQRVILLGAAVNCDNPDIKYCAEISLEPFINVFNKNDNVLKLLYGNSEKVLPAGYCGVKEKYTNMQQYCRHSTFDNEMANVFEHNVDVYLDFLSDILENNVAEHKDLVDHHKIKFERTMLSLPPGIYLIVPGANVKETYYEWQLCSYDICEIFGNTVKLYLIISPYGEVMWNISGYKIFERWQDVKQQIDEQLAANGK